MIVIALTFFGGWLRGRFRRVRNIDIVLGYSAVI